MSDYKLFTKSKSAELRAELEQAFKKSKPHGRVKVVLKKIIANIILNNNELAGLMPDVILLMKIDDVEIRKLCFHYLTNYATINPRAATDALPFFSRFRNDPNHVLRALTVKTIAYVNLPEYIDLTFDTVPHALEDSDPYVRRLAAFAIVSLYHHEPARTLKSNLIESLNDLLYDKDPVVVANALAALSDITEEGKTLTLTIDKKKCHTLISFLSKTNEWNQVYILNSLMAYGPQTSEEALELIELMIPLLQHENAAVVMNAVKLIVFYSNYVNNPELILPSLPKRLGASLISLLDKAPEIQFLVLRNVILLLLGKKYLVQFDVEMFFCKYDDPIYVKDTKLEIIYLLANDQNVSVVLRELEEYATEVDVAMARKAIRAFGNLAVKISNTATECVNVLCDLIANGISYIVQESTIVLKNILRKYPGNFYFAVEELVKHYKLIDEPDAKAAMIWILGHFCTQIENVSDILKDMLLGFKDDPTEVQYASLTAVTKYYLQVPQEGQPLVLDVLKWATEESDNPDIRDRAFFYWRLISSDKANGDSGQFQLKTKEIILNPKPLITADNDNIDPNTLDELELNIGTLASIYLKPVQYVFRLAKQKTLPNTPALQERRKQESPNESEETLSADFGERYGRNRSTLSLVPPKVPPTRRTNSSSSTVHLGIPKSHPYDDLDETKKDSLARRLSRKASIITRKK